MTDTATPTAGSQDTAGLFPPIADYGFLSNCEQSCLVAPDGSVEWLCLPRPDSPSVFGALLDRAAGLFRFGPGDTQVPQQRRYVPGTMVLETTWQTPTGWMTVQDLLVVDPLKRETAGGLPPGPGRFRRHRGAPADRDVHQRPGRGRRELRPGIRLRGNRRHVELPGRRLRRDDHRPPEGDVQLELGGTIPLGVLGARCYGRTTLTEGQSAFAALSWGDARPRLTRTRRSPR